MSSNSAPKSKESFESWESLFRKTLSKDRLLNFTKPVENPIQWIHLLDPLDHQETRTASKNFSSREGLAGESSPKKSHTFGDKIPHLKFPEAVVALAQAAAKASGESRGASSTDLSGWPLIPFSKVQMFKCEKCCLEFCSPVNHRRHLRVIHRRAAHAEKEDLRSQRQQLAAFWDALSPEEASKIVDVKNLVLEDLVGEKVAKALSRLLQQPALFALPHSYVKSGAMLLELIQCRSFKPIISSELLKILDGSSEKTFPSFGLNAMQRYVFEGGAGKVGLEAKNLVSSLGFLVELNLVKAFIKDKDEEAWRCQTALVEEEEASQRKRAQIQEKKRLKKARQKDLKEKEQKSFDSMRVFPSTGSESSDDEELSIASSLVGYDQQSRPSCNAYENLYHRLAGEESNSDFHQEEGSALPQVPAEDNQLSGELHDADVSELHSKAASPVVSSDVKENSVHGSTRSTACADTAGLEFEVEDAANDSLKKGDVQVAMGFRKTHFREKRKYPTERNPEAKDFFVPFEKAYWKERHNLSFRKLFGQTMVNSTKEGMDLAGSGAVFEESPVNRVAGYRPRQLMGKPARKYLTAVQTGTAIWTKKTPKHSDAAGNLTPVQSDLSNGTGESDSDHVACVEGPEARAAVTEVDRLCEIGVDSPLSTPGSCGPSQQSSLPSVEGGVCIIENHSSATLASDFGCGSEVDQAEHTSSLLSSVIVGSVVIGSLCVSLVDGKAGQDQRGNVSQDETGGRKVVEACEGEPIGSAQSSAKVEESLRALSENGAVNCMPHKEVERTGKASKLSSQVDSEEKENLEHPQHAAVELKLSRPIVVHAGPRGGRAKVWRPVSTSSHESQDRRVSVSPVATSVSANQTSVVEPGKDASILESVDPEEHDQGHPTVKNSTVSEPETSAAEAWTKIEGNVVEELSISASTFEAVRDFLSQRWSAAVEASDTVVLTLEDQEECESQSKGLCEDTVHIKGLRTPSLPASKDAGNGKNMRGFWKQGCPGSTMVVSRRSSGKNNFPVAPRFRYVPK